MAPKSYVYIIFRLYGRPCYVGKGVRGRWKQHVTNSCNIHLQRIYAAAGGDLPIIKVREGLTDDEACQTEIALIAAIGRGKRGPLVNLTDGGDGQTGWVPSPTTRERIRAANTGKKLSDDARRKMSEAGRGRPKSAQHKAAIANANKGKPRTATQLAAVTNPDISTREKRATAVAVYHASLTDEQKVARSAKIKATTAAAMADPQVRQKLSDAGKQRLNNHLNFSGRRSCQKSPSAGATSETV